MTKPLRIGIAGLGTVGAGVVKILAARGEYLAAATGRRIEIAAVSARDSNKDRGIDLAGIRFERDPLALAAADDIDVVAEMIGGSEGVARDLVEAALKAGKHVVTANKALLAHHGAGLARLAEAKGVALNYEAAVAGGIPIVKTMREALAANEIRSIHGILNGTCNYILTEMETTGRDFADVLKDAQELGYAEADPSFDVGGIDAAHKLAILTSLAFGTEVDFGAVQIEGIEKISATDISFAREFGYKIRLLAIAEKLDSGIVQRVHPALVPEGTPLAAVSGVYNAVAVDGDRVGHMVLEGRGAGEGPTASAVISDIADIARGLVLAPFIVPADRLKKLVQPPVDTHKKAFYLRVRAMDRAGSMAAITQALAQASVSIERIVQRGDRQDGSGRLPVVFVTHETDEGTMARARAHLAEHEDVAGTPLVLRIEDGELR
ncbi:homoserine dehydrogenase [Parvibaculum sp.]|uniref:homoserine dehydrogenase n=1 Tax=Parvibaculum sp. TaxID=2024848 RepID=UPI001DA9C5E3|nr:homoserine dehydrogenase [Parvibaculum sp.]MBX3488059.1 homoserine dehydrogenase [Parvibaculum sp.]MCW5727963.1 homoserine dehydrogenase [Parvibaculum sp.]